jgi:Mn2+/Fe2+ NRAMP family transporter
MFSTTITCLDAFPRVMNAIALELGITTEKHQQKNYLIALLLIVVATMVILLFFVKNMRGMVDFATTISFVTAPIFALLNYLVVTDRAFPTDFQVKGMYKLFAFISVIVLTLFTCSYIWMKLFL